MDELGRLNKEGRAIHVEIANIITLLSDPTTNVIEANISRQVTTVQERLLSFVKGVSKHHRHVATHVW